MHVKNREVLLLWLYSTGPGNLSKFLNMEQPCTKQFPDGPYTRYIAPIYDTLIGAFVFPSKSRQDTYLNASERLL